MEETWKRVLRGIKVPGEISDRWWRKFIEQYTQEGRTYHNMDNYLKRKIELYKELVEVNVLDTNGFVIAMFFQNFEYDSSVYGDSLVRNAQHVRDFYKDAGLDPGLSYSVIRLLGVAREGGSSKDGDEAYFLDLELAELAKPPEEYNQYLIDLQKEYSNMPHHVYRNLRLKLLQTLLLIPRIYSTDIFYERFEEQARINIQKEINEILT